MSEPTSTSRYIDRTIAYNELARRYAESERVRRQLAERVRAYKRASRKDSQMAWMNVYYALKQSYALDKEEA